MCFRLSTNFHGYRTSDSTLNKHQEGWRKDIFSYECFDSMTITVQSRKFSQDESNNSFYQVKITMILSQNHKVFRNPNLQFEVILTTNKK